MVGGFTGGFLPLCTSAPLFGRSLFSGGSCREPGRSSVRPFAVGRRREPPQNRARPARPPHRAAGSAPLVVASTTGRAVASDVLRKGNQSGERISPSARGPCRCVPRGIQWTHVAHETHACSCATAISLAQVSVCLTSHRLTWQEFQQQGPSHSPRLRRGATCGIGRP